MGWVKARTSLKQAGTLCLCSCWSGFEALQAVGDMMVLRVCLFFFFFLFSPESLIHIIIRVFTGAVGALIVEEALAI